MKQISYSQHSGLPTLYPDSVNERIFVYLNKHYTEAEKWWDWFHINYDNNTITVHMHNCITREKFIENIDLSLIILI